MPFTAREAIAAKQLRPMGQSWPESLQPTVSGGAVFLEFGEQPVAIAIKKEQAAETKRANTVHRSKSLPSVLSEQISRVIIPLPNITPKEHKPLESGRISLTDVERDD